MAEYEAYKDSGAEWLGDVPAHWEIVRLQTQLDEVNEKNDPVQTTQILSLTNKLGVVPYEDKGNQGNKSKEDLTDYKIAYPNCIVANSMNILIGSVGLSRYYGCVSPVYYVFRAKTGANIEYLNYLFSMPSFQRELRKYANGILEIRLRVSSGNILKRKVAIPPSNEQKAIVDYLNREIEHIDAIVAEAKAIIEECKAWKASIIFEAVTKGLDPNVEMKESGIEWIGKTPSNWNVTKLKLFIDILPGYAFSSDDFASDGVPLLRGINVSPNRIRWDDVVHWNKPIDGYLQPFLLQEKDLVVGLDRPWINTGTRIAFVKRNDLPALLLQRVCRIRTLGDLDIRLVKYWLESSSFRESLSTETTGVSVPHISTKQIQEFKIAVPSMSEQDEICEYLERICAKIDGLISEKESLLEDLESYKKSLIFEVVTGKRKVV